MSRNKHLLKACVMLLCCLILSIARTSAATAYSCQADINNDSAVDFKDLEIMKSEMDREDCHKVPCQADLNGDGKVDAKDREILKAELGRNDCSTSKGEILRENTVITLPVQNMGFGIDDDSEGLATYEAGEKIISEESHAAPSTTKFKDNGDGTVTDNETGFMWTKDANLPEDTMLFHHALDYIEEMNEGKYPNFGYTDWRLPALMELRSLIDYTNYTTTGHQLPSGHPFINYQSLNKDIYLSNSEFPWLVSFYCRLVGHNVELCFGYLWPVRGEQ